MENFGSTTSMEYQDPSFKVGIGAYLNVLVDNLIKIGYRREYNLFGAPYDWRKHPDSDKQF